MSPWRPSLIVAVDWSAASTIGPRSPSPDRCWIAWSMPGHAPGPEYFRTRGACTERVLELLETHDAPALVGFDFPIGYPPSLVGEALLPEGRALVERIASMIEDNGDATNNRFEVAAALNAEIRVATGMPVGPFWGRPARRPVAGLTVTKPRETGVREHRAIERTLRERGRRIHSPYQLMGIGSAGSQALMGLPAIDRILRARPGRATLWPFEPITRGDAIALAEIYPSLFGCDHIDHPIKDARQVVATRDALRDAWSAGGEPLEAPEHARREGWIAGVAPCGEPCEAPRTARPDA